MKHIPNFLSVLRIFLSITLLMISESEPLWFIIYFICGLTDMLDGWIARRFNHTSKLGSTLDSIGDFIFVVVVLVKFLLTQPFTSLMIIVICLLFFIKSISIIYGWIKFKSIPLLHTLANKLAGFAVFLFVPFYLVSNNVQPYLVLLLSGITLFSSLEELALLITSKELKLDIKSIFKCNK
ncbi:CDP-alcohol phosphatidyltransferase family protein [Enterococcus sp. LJL99]